MPTFCYSPNQKPPTPPVYILKASEASAASNKWYDPNRTWGEYAQQWENYFGFGEKLSTGDKPSNPPTVPIGKQYYYKQLPDNPDNLPYDHAFPFGVDPNDPSKPYAPFGFYCDENGNPTTTPYIKSGEIADLKYWFDQHSDAIDKESPLDVKNLDSPMDPYNMQQFFYAEKPGSPFHQYERQPDQYAPWDAVTTGEVDYKYWKQKPLPGYIEYSDQDITFKDTPENFPWLHDQDLTHHYRNGHHLRYSKSMHYFSGPYKPQINITEKIYFDSPVAPAGWHEVQQPTTPAQ